MTIRTFISGLLVAFGLSLLATAAAAAPPTAVEAFNALGESMSKGRCDRAEAEALLARKDFGTMPSIMRSGAYTTAAICGVEPVSELLRKATAEKDAPAFAFGVQFMDAAGNGRQAEALTALERAADRKSDGTLTLYIDDIVYQFAREARKQPQTYQRFLAAMDRIGWSPASEFSTADWLWRDYVGILLAQGKVADAKRVAGRIGDVRPVIEMSLIKDYAILTDGDPSQFDVMSAALSRLDRDQKTLQANPGRGDGLVEVAQDLRVLGRSDQAVELLSAALEKPGPLPDYGGEDNRNWVINEKAYALLDLGRDDEAVAAMTQAAAMMEGRQQTNVSQTINLAGVLNAVGRHQAALDTLKPFDADQPISPYGSMWVAAERSCGYLGQRRAADAQVPLDFTRAHEADNRTARAKALLCAGDIEALADHYAARLASVEDRPKALVELSRFRKPQQSPFEAELSRRFDQVRGHPKVVAAIAKVGRIGDFPIHGGPLIDFY